MSTIWKVFLVVGTLVVIFLVWQLVFNHGGILETSYNAVAGVINNTWQSISGGTSPLIPLWGTETTGGGTTLGGTKF